MTFPLNINCTFNSFKTVFVYVTLDHKTSLKSNFKIKIHHLKAEYMSFPLMYGLLGSYNIWLIYNYLEIYNLRVQKNLNTLRNKGEKIAFKVVQTKFLAMHITNQK